MHGFTDALSTVVTMSQGGMFAMRYNLIMNLIVSNLSVESPRSLAEAVTISMASR